MVMKMLGRLFGTKNSREINRLKKISDRVNGFEPKFEAYSDLELKATHTHTHTHTRTRARTGRWRGSHR